MFLVMNYQSFSISSFYCLYFFDGAFGNYLKIIHLKQYKIASTIVKLKLINKQNKQAK